jgi:hypothetical protein
MKNKSYFIITSFITLNLFFSCNNKYSKENTTAIFNDFSVESLEPVMNKSSEFKKLSIIGMYSLDTLRSVKFFKNKSSKLIKEDTIYYYKNNKFFASHNNVKYKNKNFEILSLLYRENKILNRAIFIKKNHNIFLSCVDREVKKMNFERLFINSRKKCLKFENINDFLLNQNILRSKDQYFSDYISFKLIRRNDFLVCFKTNHQSWGATGPILPDTLISEYSNLYLDFDELDKMMPPIDNSIFKCIDPSSNL